MATSDQAPPLGKAPQHYARLFYDTLLELSELEEISSVGTTTSVPVFRGKLMEVYLSLGIGNNYYTRIRRILMESGAIEYLVRGTKSYDSVLVLHDPPPDDFTIEGLTSSGEADTVPLDPEELEIRVSALESWRETAGGIHLGDALKNLEDRIRQLEERLNSG